MTVLAGAAAFLGWPEDEEADVELVATEKTPGAMQDIVASAPVPAVSIVLPALEKPEPMPRRAIAGTEPVVSTRQMVTLRSTPKGADVFRGDRKLGTTPLEIATPKNGPVRFEVRMDGYENKTVVVGPESGAQVNVALTQRAMGRVKFRFFPANAAVLIDGNRVSLPGNIADLELSEGEHSLTLRAVDSDATRTTRFHVRASEATALGTIELTRERQDNP